MLRHSFASHVLQSSGDLRAVQELLGHANITTTQAYTRLDFQHLAKIYDAAHPRALSAGTGSHAGALPCDGSAGAVAAASPAGATSPTELPAVSKGKASS